jgi:hypothetical protein
MLGGLAPAARRGARAPAPASARRAPWRAPPRARRPSTFRGAGSAGAAPEPQQSAAAAAAARRRRLPEAGGAAAPGGSGGAQDQKQPDDGTQQPPERQPAEQQPQGPGPWGELHVFWDLDNKRPREWRRAGALVRCARRAMQVARAPRSPGLPTPNPPPRARRNRPCLLPRPPPRCRRRRRLRAALEPFGRVARITAAANVATLSRTVTGSMAGAGDDDGWGYGAVAAALEADGLRCSLCGRWEGRAAPTGVGAVASGVLKRRTQPGAGARPQPPHNHPPPPKLPAPRLHLPQTLQVPGGAQHALCEAAPSGDAGAGGGERGGAGVAGKAAIGRARPKATLGASGHALTLPPSSRPSRAARAPQAAGRAEAQCVQVHQKRQGAALQVRSSGGGARRRWRRAGAAGAGAHKGDDCDPAGLAWPLNCCRACRPPQPRPPLTSAPAPRDAAADIQLPRPNLSGRKGQAVGLLLKRAGVKLLQVRGQGAAPEPSGPGPDAENAVPPKPTLRPARPRSLPASGAAPQVPNKKQAADEAIGSAIGRLAELLGAAPGAGPGAPPALARAVLVIVSDDRGFAAPLQTWLAAGGAGCVVMSARAPEEWDSPDWRVSGGASGVGFVDWGGVLGDPGEDEEAEADDGPGWDEEEDGLQFW